MGKVRIEPELYARNIHIFGNTNSQPVLIQYHNTPDEQLHYSLVHHNRQVDSLTNPFRQSIRSNHRPFLSFPLSYTTTLCPNHSNRLTGGSNIGQNKKRNKCKTDKLIRFDTVCKLTTNATVYLHFADTKKRKRNGNLMFSSCKPTKIIQIVQIFRQKNHFNQLQQKIHKYDISNSWAVFYMDFFSCFY